MSLAIIDARQWQNRFDLESGRKQDDDHPVVDMVSKVLSWNHYPGDMDDRANQWVSRTALDLIDRYEPNLVCLSFVQQFFANRHFDYPPDVRDKMFFTVMEDAFKFIAISGYTPVIIGTGGLVPLKGEMNLSGLDGLAVSSNWSARYCGIHWPSLADMDLLESLKHLGQIERIVSKAEWIQFVKAEQPDLKIHQDIALMPDFLAVAQQGFAFKTVGTTLRKPVNIPENNFKVPVYTPLGKIDDLRQVKHLVRSNLEHHKIALILVEGVGKHFFPDNSFMCSNGPGWFCNEPGDAFYLTLSTGKHDPFAYPAGYRSFDQDAETIKFPFSGYMTSIPENTLALDYSGKSIAVGNRSMFMHMMFGVDISIECFARNLFNQGCMAVVHNRDKKGKGDER
ncbi:MAG: hypothetical protein KKE44_10245 [Proteobacteria bacterium]|nr:hypothetical protein [Pseudomonadota bacterium]MBU1583103.1 hypothetical protein [Pseudomonadota bacterium]MBU2455698.1 hypothetical protein [Pseudomonadota bacterium]MBU2629368.1 hypothetical protein [Pseudomonadota bacterium]